MGVDCRDGIQPNAPENEKFSATTMAPLIDALTSCINSIHKTLDIITSVPPDRFINLPTLAVARTAYPVVSLIKIYSLLTAPESRIGQVIDMQTLKVEYYLDRVITRYRAAAALDGGRVATKFGNIIMMLRNWFVKKKENGPELREIFGAEMASDTPSDKASVRPHQPNTNNISNPYSNPTDERRNHTPPRPQRTSNGRPIQPPSNRPRIPLTQTILRPRHILIPRLHPQPNNTKPTRPNLRKRS